ncbi:MAG: hypothetical protein E6G08_08660 [Actinobacteria bacterium]|nr:MAG: hypothetical protein E6G08_08660 [Actinomycetota bacterium]
MRTRLFLATALAALLGAGLAGVALADDSGMAAKGVRYTFVGHLLATPSNGQLAITVDNGSRKALRKMLGQSVNQTFAYGSETEFLKWSNGVPKVVQPGDLAAGDVVAVHLRAPHDATLAEIEAKPAGLVGDRGPNPDHPDKPLYLFRGKLTSVGESSVTMDVAGGVRRALRLMISQPASQTFRTDGTTIYLFWQGRVPAVIAASQLKIGDRISVRIRAPKGSTLQQVESTPATKVVEHEPAQKS